MTTGNTCNNCESPLEQLLALCALCGDKIYVFQMSTDDFLMYTFSFWGGDNKSSLNETQATASLI